jgi:hypothetical protein
MEDVDLLVEVFYGYEARVEADRIAMELEELDGISEIAADEREAMVDEIKGKKPRNDLMKKPTNQNLDVTRTDNGAIGEGDDEENDPNLLNLDPDNVVLALKEFENERERKAIEDMMGASKTKKVNKAEDDAERAKREKLKQELYWDRLTGILDPQKCSVWRALNKSLNKYYQMLVNRQNLIEETGLLNQQNEELKTLLNQYL